MLYYKQIRKWKLTHVKRGGQNIEIFGGLCKYCKVCIYWLTAFMGSNNKYEYHIKQIKNEKKWIIPSYKFKYF